MIVVAVLIGLIFLIILILFTSRTLSPIPYFPSNHRDMDNIIKALNLHDNQVVIDLGAGDGWVIFEAARYAHNHQLNTQFIAVDINPILVLIMHIWRLGNPNRNNIRILRDDMFKMNYKDLLRHSGLSRISGLQTTFYLYISPWFLEEVVDKIYKELPHSKIVSYFYSVKSYKAKERILGGIHPTHVYE